MDPKRSPPRNRPSVPRMDKRTFRVHYSFVCPEHGSRLCHRIPYYSTFFPLYFFISTKATEGNFVTNNQKLPRCRVIAPSWDFPTISKDFHEFLTLLNWIQLATMIRFVHHLKIIHFFGPIQKQDKKLHRIELNCLDEHPATPQRKPHFSSASRWRL